MKLLRHSASPSHSTEPVTQTQLRQLLAAAHRAPTPNNTQPFRFRAQKQEEVEVWLDERRVLHGLDFAGTSELLSLGATLENLRQEGQALGVSARWTVLNAPGGPGEASQGPLARVCLERCAPCVSDLAPCIPLRRTNRWPFAREAPGLNALRALEKQASTASCVRFSSHRDAVREVADAVGFADGLRAQNKVAHAELHQWLRHTAREARRTSDGLDVGLLGINAFLRLFLRVSAPWPVMQVCSLFGAKRAASGVGRNQVLASGAVGVVTAPWFDPEAIVDAGATLERVWLQATAMGLGLSVLGVLPPTLLRAVHAPESIQPQARAKLLAFVPRLWAHLGIPEGHHLLALVRVGLPLHSPPVSERLPLSAIVAGLP